MKLIYQTEEERKICREASALFGKLLDDLKTRNMLRQTTRGEKRRLLSVLKNTWEFQNAFMEITECYDPRNFNDFAVKTGLTKETLVYSFLAQVLSNLLICYESLIKLPLVFFIDETCGVTKTVTLGKLLNKLGAISPSFVKGFKPMINTELRNAIAHATFWLEIDGLHYAKNSYLEEEKKVPLEQLKKETRNTSIVGRAFVHVIREKAEKGYL